MLESVPAFLALNLDLASCRRVAALQRDLRALASPPGSVSWTSPTNLRIVLRYLGAVEPSLTPAMLDPLRDWIAGLAPIRLTLGPLEAFPAPDRARLITVAVGEGASALQQVADHVGAHLHELGLPPQKLPFHPHLTLARLAAAADAQAWLAPLPAFSCEARLTELAAYVHAQKRPGGEHIALDRLAFAPPPRTSQRPSKAARQPSQRPSKRPKPDPAAARMEKIPSAPRLPSIPGPPPVGSGAAAPAPEPQAPRLPEGQPAAAAPVASPDAQSAATTPSSPSRSSSILPPALEAVLPPEDDWGS